MLFQPLTLLDCLHTFCGACLKEWFAFQASTAASIHPYTCPACRASVRTAQPNANVTTLLDIFLKANPARGKSEEDKKADRERYRPGDTVLPRLRRRDERDEAERRLLEETQQLSLRELGLSGGGRSRSRDSRPSRDRRRSTSRNPPTPTSVPVPAPVPVMVPVPAPSPSPTRAVEHQSSLRSLLSASELDANAMDEGLVRRVLEELVAEGVDLAQIGLAQEEEITERIAEAVRRRQAERHAERQRERRERRERIAREGLASPRRAYGQPDSGPSTPGPPISRPALLGAANANRTRRLSHQRSSSHGSSQPARRARDDRSDRDIRERPTARRRQSDSLDLTTTLHAREQFHNNPRPPSPPPATYVEPSIACRHCHKEHIEYELHYHCAKCDDATFNICLSCYRLGKGCKHWFGFGWAAGLLYEHQAPQGGYPPNHEPPHILIGHRYRRPFTPDAPDDPAERLELGVFCDICKAFANACYWQCDYCNQGDWGFCNDCVNQGRHCTHPLLPVAQKESEQAAPDLDPTPPTQSNSRSDVGLAPPDHDVEPTTPPLTPKSASLIQGPAYVTIGTSVFRPLTFTTLCNVCRYPIPPSHTRYHCLKCNAGDYDICMGCYHKANVSGRISKEDGSSGWRKCFRGHRMIVVGFEDRDDGQRRIVVRDLVGGHALKEEQAHSTARSGAHHAPLRSLDDKRNNQNARAPSNAMSSPQRYPPDGGGGLRLQAKWPYWPEEGIQDELAFPKVAEIREAVDINGDWYWGVYCGGKGLFPANHVTAI